MTSTIWPGNSAFAARAVARAVGERHQHAALHDPAPVVMLVRGRERIEVGFALHARPEWTDQADEALVGVGLPAVGGGIKRRFFGSVGGFGHRPWSCRLRRRTVGWVERERNPSPQAPAGRDGGGVVQPFLRPAPM